MKHKHRLIITYFLIATPLCNAMEKSPNILERFQEITDIKNPIRAQFFSKHQIIITDMDWLTHIINLKTKKSEIIKPPCDNRWVSTFVKQHPILQNNGNKIVICGDKTVTINEALTGKQIWEHTEKTKINSIAWKPSKNTIFLCCQSYYSQNNKSSIKKYNYLTNDHKEIAIDKQMYEFITIHPTKEVMCLVDATGNIYWHELDNTSSTKKRLPIRIIGSAHSCQYNADGSYVAVGYPNKIILVDQNKTPNPLLYLSAPEGEFFNEIIPQKNEHFHKIIFHPNNSILAILGSKTTNVPQEVYSMKNYLRYYDIKKLQYIDKPIEFPKNIRLYDLAISDDGLSILMTSDNKCIKMPIAFAVKEKCLFSLCVLNQFKYNNEQNLPQDVARYITNILLHNIVS